MVGCADPPSNVGGREGSLGCTCASMNNDVTQAVLSTCNAAHDLTIKRVVRFVRTKRSDILQIDTRISFGGDSRRTSSRARHDHSLKIHTVALKIHNVDLKIHTVALKIHNAALKIHNSPTSSLRAPYVRVEP
eukprot:857899-Pyramimonas_sp.AAC.1